jgi:SulP family sulfate permease
MKNLLSNLKQNWKSGITVALVSIPLSISLAVASGTTPTVGIITAIFAGLVSSIFGGSNFNIIGPTGALSGLIATYAIANGAAALPTLTVVAGLIIILAYFLKLEKYLIFIPSSVIHGFTLGVALIIAFNQFNSAFGLYGLPKHEHFFNNVTESILHLSQASFPTFFIFLCFLFSLFILRKLLPKIPGALILSPIGILIGYLGAADLVSFKLVTLQNAFGDIPFKLFEQSSFQFNFSIISTASAIALVAILETMLSAKIADGMTHTKHNERKEMLGLGLANIASGVMGGIPATAALARTSLNVKTGATHKISATISAISLTIISFFLLTYFKYIPMAVIAAILVNVAIQMIETEHFAKFYKYQKSGFWLSLLVAAVTFYEDPIVGILLGTALSLIIFVEKLSHGQFDIKLNKFQEGIIKTVSGDVLKEIEENADILLYSIEGKLSYINSLAHVRRFEDSLKKYKVVVLRLRSVAFMDIDGVEALDEIIATIQKRKQQVCLTSINENVLSILEQASSGYKKLKAKELVFDKTESALKHFGIAPREPKSV